MTGPNTWLELNDIPALRPPLTANGGRQHSVKELVALSIALGRHQTRTAVMRETGLGRSQVAKAWEKLIEQQIIEAAGTEQRDARGKPSMLVRMHPKAGMVLAVDCGASLGRLALSTVGGKLLLRKGFTLDLAAGPNAFLKMLSDLVNDTVAAGIPAHGPLRFVTLGIPARIDYADHTPVRPTIMPGWDGIRVGALLEEAYGADAHVDNEVNLRAYAESLHHRRRDFPIVTIKVGWGIGAGIATAPGVILHGYGGAAGEIGHTPVADAPGKYKCRCGKENCVEVRASIGAILADYEGTADRRMSIDPEGQERLMEALRQGDPAAEEAVRTAGFAIGDTVAGICDMLNPRVVSLVSILNEVTESLLGSVRSRVYANARPLASRDVSISLPSFGLDTGLVGGLAFSTIRAVEALCS